MNLSGLHAGTLTGKSVLIVFTRARRKKLDFKFYLEFLIFVYTILCTNTKNCRCPCWCEMATPLMDKCLINSVMLRIAYKFSLKLRGPVWARSLSLGPGKTTSEPVLILQILTMLYLSFFDKYSIGAC